MLYLTHLCQTPLFDVPAQVENPSEFLDETFAAESRGMRLLYTVKIA